ncbi:DUF4360 domain-containing protein [Pilimelia terevasa]|uniref:DUF4360 domain-containing protein n=1 Tax=Pilimelia terevasa TaxID=53372 RepID=UPI001664059A|nr:DUF4360 domain-containing protein [Pilimelia terevasa]
MTAAAVLGAALPIILVAGVADAVASPAPRPTETITYSGSAGPGCVKNGVTPSELGDGSLRLRYPAMTVKAPASTGVNCTVRFTVDTPAGWTFAVPRATYTGAAKLTGGARATLSTKFVFSGQPGQVASAGFESLHGGYVVPTVFRDDQLTFMPCGAKPFLSMTAHIGIDAAVPGVPAGVSVESVLLTPSDFVWRQCAASASGSAQR